MNSTIKKYCDFYYQVVKVEGGYGWNIYNEYGKGRETLQTQEDLCDTPTEAEQDARDAITYYYV
jgi:hypothetical protein